MLAFLLLFTQAALSANPTHHEFEKILKTHRQTWNAIPKGPQIAILQLICDETLSATKPDPFERLFNYVYEENPYKNPQAATFFNELFKTLYKKWQKIIQDKIDHFEPDGTMMSPQNFYGYHMACLDNLNPSKKDAFKKKVVLENQKITESMNEFFSKIFTKTKDAKGSVNNWNRWYAKKILHLIQQEDYALAESHILVLSCLLQTLQTPKADQAPEDGYFSITTINKSTVDWFSKTMKDRLTIHQILEGRAIPRDASNSTIRRTLDLLAKTKPGLLNHDLFSEVVHNVQNRHETQALQNILELAQILSKKLPQKMLPAKKPILYMKASPRKGKRLAIIPART